jgi:predicted methyltransferase
MRIVTALAAIMLAAAPAGLAQSVDPVGTALADPRRPVEDLARDEVRASAEMLGFSAIRPGARVADIRPEEGFFARLFAVAVGPEGKVYAFVPTRTAGRENAYADALAATYGNVERITGPLDAMTFPEPLDVVFSAQEYHDFHIPGFQTEPAHLCRPEARRSLRDHRP